MSPADRAKHVVAAFRQQGLSDAELERIIASAITRAINEEREQCAFMANAEAFMLTGETNDMDLGKQTAYTDMAMQIRQRSHKQPKATPAV